ncbi:RING-H2 finger protein atl47 [Phtheirospermum japonicum]|uniref:RING-type E3 ubiquitin transferase n=1 Tax=Phtheirospermum japonicum TaxID=374723 RepID=A0A830B4Z4_9LAMI|nr:RING-H2 finger protein atl47 [Phtheirospermum japonicum]
MSSIQSAFGSKISPIILVIIVLLAAVFFISALLHLLIRYLIKQRSANSHNYPQVSSSGAFQRQLQQLFHLHDSGLDQAYIDALPVFLYKDIMGSKEPFDCAVCLCEFSEQDRLRLLPSCSHAFHIDCIDTWLLSNSTCPLCRGVILSNGYSYENPFFYFEDSKESVEDGGGGGISGNLGDNSAVISEKRVFSVRLGKFKSCTNNNNNNNTINNNNNNNNNNGGARRCFSMGSFQYVVDELDLQVALCPSGRERINGGEADGKKINNRAKGESFSVSKIWLWSKKGKFPNLP